MGSKKGRRKVIHRSVFCFKPAYGQSRILGLIPISSRIANLSCWFITPSALLRELFFNDLRSSSSSLERAWLGAFRSIWEYSDFKSEYVHPQGGVGFENENFRNSLEIKPYRPDSVGKLKKSLKLPLWLLLIFNKSITWFLSFSASFRKILGYESSVISYRWVASLFVLRESCCPRYNPLQKAMALNRLVVP